MSERPSEWVQPLPSDSVSAAMKGYVTLDTLDQLELRATGNNTLTTLRCMVTGRLCAQQGASVVRCGG